LTWPSFSEHPVIRTSTISTPLWKIYISSSYTCTTHFLIQDNATVVFKNLSCKNHWNGSWCLYPLLHLDCFR
jgi:hypothetical protein